MPWENYRLMTDSDLKSIYRYLRRYPRQPTTWGPIAEQRAGAHIAPSESHRRIPPVSPLRVPVRRRPVAAAWLALACWCAACSSAGSTGSAQPAGHQDAGTRQLADTPSAADTTSAADAEVAVDTTVAADTTIVADSAPDASTPPPAPTVASWQSATQAGDAAALQTWLDAYDMPVCDLSHCVFAIHAPKAAAVELLGDWNGWQNGDPMSKSTLLAGWFFAKIALVLDNVRQYKAKIDGQWALDPSNRHIRFADLGPNSAIYPASTSRILLVSGIASAQLAAPRELYVYLPAAYFAQPTAHFGVLYWQDGWNVFANPKAPFGSWDVDIAADKLMASGQVAPVIMVGIATDDRMSEYVWAPLAYGGKTYPAKLPAYAELVVDTIKPLIDSQFRTHKDRAHTAIGGSSLGGISALWIAWQRWQTFGAFASFSGAYWIGEDIAGEAKPTGLPARTIIADNTAKVPAGALRAYIDSGDRPFTGSACYACDSWAYSDWTRNALLNAGWQNRSVWDTDSVLTTAPDNLPTTTSPAKVPSLAWSDTPPAGESWASYLGTDRNLLSLVGHGHQHNEAAWRDRVGAALRFLFPGPAL